MELHMNPFKGRHFQRDIILWAVRWYCKYGISYRELQEMLAERGVNVDHSTMPQSPGSFADYAGMLLSAAGQFGSEMWQPSVASAAAGTSPLEEDKVACEKHSGPQYLAEGSKSVFINGQPAVRAKDRTTCEGTVSDDVSPNVIIGGDTLTVRDIKSGKTPGLALGMIALSLLRGRPGQDPQKHALRAGSGWRWDAGRYGGECRVWLLAPGSRRHRREGAERRR